MFLTLATSLVVLFNFYATADILTNFYSNASCFSLLLLYLGNSQVSVYRNIGSTLVYVCQREHSMIQSKTTGYEVNI